MARPALNIVVRGAGVVGLWQALVLARRGHTVRIHERSSQPFANACSIYAGAMLALRCEEDNVEPVVNALGKRGIALWRETYPGTAINGTLAVALGRDRAELDRFARMTSGHRQLSPAEVAALEPSLGNRFAGALFFAEEAHLDPESALRFLLDRVRAEGVALRFGDGAAPEGA